MKIEMGESLFYSWLRHVKECQIVQTNWKVSPQWNLENEPELQHIFEVTSSFFEKEYDYHIFKQNASLSQILQQGECDAIGISVQDGQNHVFAVDVAFHEGGLNYGPREVTVMKVIAKTVRTAMCLLGYMDTKAAEIIFASPKINPAVMKDIAPCIQDLNKLFKDLGYDFNARIIANDVFCNSVLQPILLISDGVADTSELFLRSYQLYTMFSDTASKHKAEPMMIENSENAYSELKVGQIAQSILRRLLEDGSVPEEEVEKLLLAEYSKNVFDLNYPLLVKSDDNYDSARYYAKAIIIGGNEYRLCSQWFETSANNDRPYLINWINRYL